MGRPDTMILVSGAQRALERSKRVLETFAGNVKYLGEDVWGAIAETEGFRVDDFGKLVAKISPTFGEFFAHEGAVIQSGNYQISESPLQISVDATERLARSAREAGINAEVPALAAELFRRAAAAGHAEREVAALIEVFRGRAGDVYSRAG
jgi:3-hydroxyisobutyrate dehydrogenase-like beta-hydroxyacid dehydrogenase